MIKHADSHLDHALTDAQIAYLLTRFADRQSFFIETIWLPVELGWVPCGLYGPTMEDPAIEDADVTYAPRPPRTWNSRLVDRPMRLVRTITVVAGPHEVECTRCNAAAGAWNLLHRAACTDCGGTQKRKLACVLYTAYGGPQAPQEPTDPQCRDQVASAAFWRVHALAR